MARAGIRDKVSIVGVGCCQFGENWDQSPSDMIVDAAYEAYADAGIEDPQKQIDADLKEIDEITSGVLVPVAPSGEGVTAAGSLLVERLGRDIGNARRDATEYMAMAGALGEQDDIEEAEVLFDRALELQPSLLFEGSMPKTQLVRGRTSWQRLQSFLRSRADQRE